MVKARILLSIILLASMVFQANASLISDPGDPYISKEFTLTGAGDLEIETAGASVSVWGNEGNQVLVELFVQRNGNPVDIQDPEVQKRLENYSIDISQKSNTISVLVENKNNNNWRKGNNNLHLAFKIQVPRAMSSNFNTSGGSISLEGLEGEQEIRSSGGSIRVVDCLGSIDARSSGGSFDIAQFNGNVDIHSSGGSIKVSDYTGELAINSSGGSVNLDDVSGSISANTSGGSIKANILTLENALTLKASGGSISAIVPRDLGMDLDLSGGRVNTALTNFEGEMKDNKIQGKINGGGVLVTLASSGGSVKLDYR